MKQVNHAQQEAYQELLTVTKWTVQMLDQGDIVYGGNSVNPHNYNEFCNWAAAVRAAVARAEIGDDFPRGSKKTHTDVELPQLKGNSHVR